LKYDLVKLLACPECRCSDLSLQTTGVEQNKRFTATALAAAGAEESLEDARRGSDEVIEGALSCQGCGLVYPIRGGIPRMMPSGAKAGPPTQHRFTEFDTAVPEWEANFLDIADPLVPESFLGKIVLDAGCGFGRHAFFAARYGAEVVALDSSPDAIAATHRNTAKLAHVHVVHGDIYRPPFREGVFDLTYSFGVLHHLDDPHEAFRVLGRTLRPGGRLSLFVYGPRQGASAAANNALRGVTADLEADKLEMVSRGIARGLRVFSHTPYRLLRGLPVARSLVKHLPVHDHHQWPFGVVVADVYDRLRIPVKHWFTGEKLEGWLAAEGYVDVQVTRRVRNNETFRATGVRR
jgi:SAM-dependent methyltransferase